MVAELAAVVAAETVEDQYADGITDDVLADVVACRVWMKVCLIWSSILLATIP